MRKLFGFLCQIKLFTHVLKAFNEVLDEGDVILNELYDFVNDLLCCIHYSFTSRQISLKIL